jgi:hypothetical protein
MTGTAGARAQANLVDLVRGEGWLVHVTAQIWRDVQLRGLSAGRSVRFRGRVGAERDPKAILGAHRAGLPLSLSGSGSALSPVNTRSYRVRARAFQSVAGSISHKPAKIRHFP